MGGKDTTPRLSRGRRFDSALLTLALVLPACSPAYVLRAGYEEAKILWRRQPIEKVLQRADLDSETRSKLELVLAVRVFAGDTLHLRVNGSYGSLAHVNADQVVHVVSAAERLRLDWYTWWFPFVGRVPYKGFFSAPAAQEEAAALERQGYDTYVRPSVAFSTLGWFADPLLSNLLRYDRVTLSDIVIHELLHNTTYVAGHADFDESFANFVGSRGAMVFFAGRHDGAAVQQASDAWADTLLFSDFLDRFTVHLRAAYAGGLTLAERERLFAGAQVEFRQLPLRTAAYSEFGSTPLNNAVILHDLLYADRLRLFDDLCRQEHDDLPRTIAVIIAAVHAADGDPFAAVEGALHRAEQQAGPAAPAPRRVAAGGARRMQPTRSGAAAVGELLTPDAALLEARAPIEPGPARPKSNSPGAGRLAYGLLSVRSGTVGRHSVSGRIHVPARRPERLTPAGVARAG